MIKRTFSRLCTLWETNRHQLNFWISLIAFGGIIMLMVAKWIWHITISAADISVIISAIGSLIILIGNILNNQILISTGSKLQDPQFKQALEDANQTIELLTKELTAVKQRQAGGTKQIKRK
ncbi:hypothetical protein [Liquorilactobacillus mali]|uniref:Uncharacterized protein n=1 Tax=Liquorilactobacillus mali KCTC 3596 = DSM 20444 TaxID=1046596 RepID=A0A0R2E133_9LACO|nr:hypothetical protein [Liquorilactobacillus mali]KRN09254.1 hypothetical protein FD00_GL001310 [Liquorilactobacillus mali KCTC 3596 = DSM 20444]MDC7952438.1 hypothetical protein [Liquorilactobacillus mali]QFQ75757.1 hypothetical protein LM596_12020 [Liquorilactobacillus mali]